jgi:lysozyme family protein
LNRRFFEEIMSSFDVAFQFLMDNEDAARAYAVVPDAPPGAHAISGINSAAFPGEFEAIAALAQNERALAVEQFYERNFWNQWYAQLTSDEVAKRVFDAAVNAGSVAAVKCLQEAVNFDCEYHMCPHAQILVDGCWGPVTVEAANNCDPVDLVSAFQQARVAHYKAIVAANPADAVYLAAWAARAER